MRFSLARKNPYRTNRCRPWKPRCGEGQLSCSCCASSFISGTREAIELAAGRRCSCWASRLTSSKSSPGFYALDLRWRLPDPRFQLRHAGRILDHDRLRFSSMTFACAGTTRSPGWRWPRSPWRKCGSARRPCSLCTPRLSLLCALLAIWHTLAGRAADLVEGRRRLRIVFALVTALYTVLIVASDWLWPGGLSAASLSFANAAGLVTLDFPVRGAGLAAIVRSNHWRLRRRRPPTQSFGNGVRAAASPAGPDAALLTALRKLIDHDKVYREPDLSIASLAQKLDIPEYRLRRLINEQLGHRNFSAFINGYRLAEAETALGDPAQAEVPVLTIALDAGFGSIGPFNRAFKAHTGLTPTEYRRARLDGADGAEPRRFLKRADRFQNSASLAAEIGERPRFACATLRFAGRCPHAEDRHDAADPDSAICASRRDRDRDPRRSRHRHGDAAQLQLARLPRLARRRARPAIFRLRRSCRSASREPADRFGLEPPAVHGAAEQRCLCRRCS